ncbi:MAG: D-glycero-beta-D-manno-heptose 1,7-bisphosphate 7-phosphatase [Gammaproteobacteria bacterium]|nr:D-glycero-beta-D-manno-heptose 1,7-bisphosphate 7-phosphatase [Gammaproteobacteria bacterium]MDH5799589.1 D-glycero-beta-D-manno-heptose 1,7-bisphosphate 7-phosphatase [Gammaproteobacteria bacterium]
MKTIILDRDGVINADSDSYIKSPEEFVPIPGSLEAIARLNRAGYRVLVATNQSGIARGYFDEAILAQMHDKLRRGLQALGGEVARIVFCPHGPDDGCSCRKPKPGMLLELIQIYGLNSADIPVVGDSLRDLEAAVAVGANPVLVKTGKGERTLAKIRDDSDPLWQDLPVYDNLAAAVDDILLKNGD